MNRDCKPLRRKISVISLPVMCVMASACGRVPRDVVQTVTIKLMDRETKKTVKNATVQIKPAWKSVLSDSEQENIAKRNWEATLWHQGISDEEGGVSVTIRIKALDGTGRGIPLPHQNVSNRLFLMKVMTDNDATDELEILLNAQAMGETDRFVIEIVDIGKAAYGK